MNSGYIIPDAADPIALFRQWYSEAAKWEPALPEAMSLATATRDGRPSVRMVLLKGVSDAGFVFYTNAESRKGEEIAANPQGALCFHWKALGRQVRAEGALTETGAADADAYFASRPRPGQIAAWASSQSRPLTERRVLVDRYKEFEKHFENGPVSRPPYWKGFRLEPDLIEFWHDVRDRMHDRLVFRRLADGWRSERLNP